ncbi:gluconeogenesis factor YvcK family protein [Metalysinibacillus jejuensis]|uniref:gluconeogenesis factor YvcK family protein n=1 Tax=Metalysinibacillus jejuensis TaxID=914327 RepID=UPI000D382B8F|nr:gluconeogenesis factor YvcK family protein [Metalysinibacillus jejuensis]
MRKNPIKLVVIGGGTGLSTLLRGLKRFPFDITAIVTVADDGGSSGRLRDDYDIPPPGDVRNVIAALSDVEPLVEQMFQYRFSHSDDLHGHSLGNLMLTALTDITGDFSYAISEMSRVLQVHGHVLPAANKKVTLRAELEDGTIITGESNVPTAQSRIHRVYLEPENVKPLPAAIRAIERADLIVLGPGSLYTSIIPNLLVKNISKALCRTRAPKLYICNLMTQLGETIGYNAEDHINALHDHVGRPFIDAVLVNDLEQSTLVQTICSIGKVKPVTYDEQRLVEKGIKVIKRDIAIIREDTLCHEANEVAKWLYDYMLKETQLPHKKSRLL